MVAKLLIYVTLFLLVQNSLTETIRESLFRSDTCSKNQHSCSNNRCIAKSSYCDSIDDCEDNSDELYCNGYYGCPSVSHFRCKELHHSREICIPNTWKCDGVKDCYNAVDETGCDLTKKREITISDQLTFASTTALHWILRNRNDNRKLQKWGIDLPRKAVSLYMSYKTKSDNDHIDEMAYELSSDFLFKIALKKIDDVPTADIASYVNAFLVTCINPREFYVLNLVKELRTRMDNMNGTNPYALLAMCNAHETITARDVQKLEEAFGIAQEKHRIDTMAMIVLALSCASNQQDKVVDKENLSNLVSELKKRQYRNGTVENVKTTALVMQALFASEEESDENEFDAKKAIQQILRSDSSDGSFGNLANTYYVIPVLNGLSLINISAEHCPTFVKDEREGIQHLKDQLGEKLSVKYSLWIGDDKFIQRTLTMSVPKNSSFYGIMEYASDLDVNYRFEYNIRNRKPFIYSLYRFMDDPEKEMFWTFNRLINETSGEVERMDKSPADVYPKNNDHLVYWYKTEA